MKEPGPKLTYLIGRLNRVLRKRLGEALAPFEISVAQYTTLSVLHVRTNLSNAQLAKRAFITPQAMNEVIQGLEARKLVTRQASASHGRIVQLLLTDSGLELMHECHAATAELERSMLGPLNAAEQQTLHKALILSSRALEERDPARVEFRYASSS